VWPATAPPAPAEPDIDTLMDRLADALEIALLRTYGTSGR
jgi:hypothetical protein